MELDRPIDRPSLAWQWQQRHQYYQPALPTTTKKPTTSIPKYAIITHARFHNKSTRRVHNNFIQLIFLSVGLGQLWSQLSALGSQVSSDPGLVCAPSPSLSRLLACLLCVSIVINCVALCVYVCVPWCVWGSSKGAQAFMLLSAAAASATMKPFFVTSIGNVLLNMQSDSASTSTGSADRWIARAGLC